MIKRIHKMALITWDIISGDTLTALEEVEGKNTMTRDEVIEVVADADYMMFHGQDKEAYEAWKVLTFEEQDKILKGAFTFKRYGW